MTALIFAIVLLFLYSAWRAIIAFLFAIFFAYLLEAPVSRLEKWFRGSRGIAILAGLSDLYRLADYYFRDRRAARD